VQEGELVLEDGSKGKGNKWNEKAIEPRRSIKNLWLFDNFCGWLEDSIFPDGIVKIKYRFIKSTDHIYHPVTCSFKGRYGSHHPSHLSS
jgi:hypothetical protein